MRITNLTQKSSFYTSNVYLLRGDWNAISDINTLIDAGRDPNIIPSIRQIPTGVGKKAVDLIILTHNHYDHAELVPILKKEFNPLVLAYLSYQNADEYLKGQEIIKVADRMCEIIHAPGHSNDSICLYFKEDKILFSGDFPINLIDTNGTYPDDYIDILDKLSNRQINTIYPGHGNPIPDANKVIMRSLRNAKNGLADSFV